MLNKRCVSAIRLKRWGVDACTAQRQRTVQGMCITPVDDFFSNSSNFLENYGDRETESCDVENISPRSVGSRALSKMQGLAFSVNCL